jgi:hypothetical protein
VTATRIPPALFVSLLLLSGPILGLGIVAAQEPQDTAFASLQERGRTAMGIDQYTSTHRFDDLPDGGRIELRQNQPDTVGVRAIRAHLARVALGFAAGDFSTPGMVHAQPVPGTGTMAAKHAMINYRFRPLPGGGEIRIITRDPEALEAVHAFLAFQRRAHRAGGKEHNH